MTRTTIDLDVRCGECPGCRLRERYADSLAFLDDSYEVRARRVPVPKYYERLESSELAGPPWAAALDHILRDRDVARASLVEKIESEAVCSGRVLWEAEWNEEEWAEKS